ncbi:hypothetical protein Syn7803C76_15 [Synechococcus phage ACG-2014b]|jgi:hypothetical protein|uniref:Gp22 n=2 Tax=Synechococcus phage ACG-2014b TaxID=1493508 RepID=A0A0E3HBI4_9CAUD|nr:Phd-like antitoxin [Synechococcus phage ACG-2014b]YP_009779644.1 Phd-like antitoxin [Synechococcus phage ACG-2014b]YP_009779858.1 Phd-like antitoxin [Synechococcus phage ACG-2014b]AIX17238.1 hypothetical protein Syn7803C61_16 [Synechococcus phage ACG-2014b]AIX17452.1 hypothetical protein Syn7803C66_15 [Synechococcus phage ACG-2014b]AIX17667.1 hypothetical protein Syn7803C67_15 [Synechococcus phage ACG-2014b]AIX17884.1 hypothetical protein Syn7803C68_16 [Synechococcus phage ACG-2014b]AIX18
MTEFIRVTLEEAEKYFEFMVDMCERNRCVWRIERPDGAAVILAPVVQSGPPLSDDVIDQVEEFRKQFIDEQNEVS